MPQHTLHDSEMIRFRRERIALALFRQLDGVRFTHYWGGSAGVPRNWHPHAVCEDKTRIAPAQLGWRPVIASLANR